jgi:xanthine dehydrogenase accessory factor
MLGAMQQSPDHVLIPETALAWHRAGKGAALATVVETWGSAPRPVGAQLAISAAGEIMGSVSGGCVEGAVVAEALDLIGKAPGQIFTYGVSDDNAFSVGLACGGTIRVLVEPIGGAGITEGDLARLCALRAERKAAAFVTNTETWARRIDLPPAHLERFRGDKSGFDEAEFIAIHNPPLRMVVVGAVHIAQPLMQMARLTGYDAVLIDPRESFGSAARFPGERILTGWPDEALVQHGLDARTAVVTLTHDSKLDDPAIKVALRSECFYLGSLGSTRTHAKRIERLTAEGFSPDELAKIHAPVGLDIGARSPAEIAVSIMAQITTKLRQG